MHIEDGIVVGAYVSDLETSGRNTIVTILDIDNTPTREFTTYKYIQTPQLARMGISVNPKGVITIDTQTYNNYLRVNDIAISDIPLILEFNNKKYACDLAATAEIGNYLTFTPVEETEFINIYNDVTIPSVTSHDEGKVLTVRDEYGILEWKDNPKEVRVVHITLTATAYSADATFSIITTDIENGKVVVAEFSGTIYYLTEHNSNTITFVRYSVVNEKMYSTTISISSTNYVSRTERYITGIPTVQNNGDKILTSDGSSATWKHPAGYRSLNIIIKDDNTLGILTYYRTTSSIANSAQAGESAYSVLTQFCIGSEVTIAADPQSTIGNKITRGIVVNRTTYTNPNGCGIEILGRNDNDGQRYIETYKILATTYAVSIVNRCTVSEFAIPSIASGDSGKVLKVNSGETGVEWGAAGGGSTLYQHNIQYSYSVSSATTKFCVNLVIINTSSDSINSIAKLKTAIGSAQVICSGGIWNNSVFGIPTYIYYSSGFIIYYVTEASNGAGYEATVSTLGSVNDSVLTIS